VDRRSRTIAVVDEAAPLRERLADIEAEFATLEAELTAFWADYMRQVGTVMARVHELEARILAIVAERSGAPSATEAAEAAQERARKSTADLRAVPKGGPVPTADLKRLFREAAKRMHPDLARDDGARVHAEAFMKRLNQFYRAGDAPAIRDLVRQWEASPYAPVPDDGAARRARAARQIGALRAAVARAERRLEDLRASELAATMERAMAASVAGRDLLAEMRTAAETSLAEAQARLAALG
jgi:hypothetical protein